MPNPPAPGTFLGLDNPNVPEHLRKAAVEHNEEVKKKQEQALRQAINGVNDRLARQPLKTTYPPGTGTASDLSQLLAEKEELIRRRASLGGINTESNVDKDPLEDQFKKLQREHLAAMEESRNRRAAAEEAAKPTPEDEKFYAEREAAFRDIVVKLETQLKTFIDSGIIGDNDHGQTILNLTQAYVLLVSSR